MQDHALVEAIVAGDPDGIAEAYDRYAASLYAHCCSVRPGPEATWAVLDTFLIAVARLDGLGEPERLEAWLHAVARNECQRLRGLQAPGAADRDDELPAVTPPADLRGRVLAACTDNTPAGRARRVSVAHRAGPFGPTGFPRAIGASGPPWWQRVRHPWVAVAAVTLAATALTAGVTVIMTAGGPHRPQASALELGGVAAAGSASSLGPTSTGPTTGPSPARQASPSPSRPAPSVTSPAGTPSRPAGGRTPEPSFSPAPTPTPPASPTPVRSSAPPPPPSRSPSPPPPPSQGELVVTPARLQLTAGKGKTASGVFMLTAVNGPVSAYTIEVAGGAAGKITVSPDTGSLPANGSVTVAVTVTSNTALNAEILVDPGNLAVQVMFKTAKN